VGPYGPPPTPPGPAGGRRPLLVGLAVVAVAGIGLAVVATRDDGGDSSGGGTGGSSATGWTDETRSNPFRLVSDGEVVCTSGLTADLYCLDAATGEELWEADLATTPSTSPALARDMVLVGDDGRGGDDGLHAYSLDGEEIWSTHVEASSQELSPLHLPVIGDTAAVIDDGPPAGVLTGIDVATGEERWTAFEDPEEGQPEISNFSDVLTDGERLYVTTETMPPFDPGVTLPMGPAMTLVALDPATGEELWQWEISPESTAFPVAAEVALLPDAGAAAFIVESGGSPGHLVVLDTASGELRWDAPLEASDSSVAHVDGMIVVADGTAMRGYDHQGGEVWAAPMPDELGLGLGGLVVTEGRLFSSSYDVYEIDPATGTSALVRPSVSSADVEIVGDLLVMAGMSGLEAVPLPEPP
jgi:outer membrane protein assembly factor BamB